MADLREQLQTSLASAYTLERELGGGGMSRVFVAEELSLCRKVVIKVLPPELAATVNVERFRREIQLAAKLQHPHIVPVLAAGISDGLPFYTMPFIEGESLRARLERSGELPVRETARILRDVLSALSYAHEHGVVHRDIKPENVLLTGQDAFVADFGVAKALSAATTAGPSLTSIGIALGTPAYMSPEQAAADPATDHRTDLYSVGAMAYELLTGQQVFSARSPQGMLAAHAVETPEPIDKRRPAVPRDLASLIMRSLEKHAADRPQSAGEMLAALEAAVTPSGATTAHGAAPFERAAAFAPSGVARHRARWKHIMAAGVAIAAIGATVLLVAPRLNLSGSAAEAAVPHSIAVLPLVNVGSDTANAYFADGMTDEVTSMLARVPGLRVASRSTVASIELRGPLGPADLGRKLGVKSILEGNIRRQGSRLRLTVSLVDVDNGAIRWTETYDREVKDAFEVQEELARSIASSLMPNQSREGVLQPIRATSGTKNERAHDFALRAHYQSNIYTEESLRRAITLFQQAISLDTAYADAWTGLGTAWARLADDFIPAKEALPHMRTALARALALDPDLADAHVFLAGMQLFYERDFAAAERELTLASAIDSTLADATDFTVALQVVAGRADSGVAVLRRGFKLDPLSPLLARNATRALLLLNRTEEARQACDRAKEVDPAYGSQCTALMLWVDGRYDELVQLLRANPRPTAATHAFLAKALWKLGRRKEAAAEAEQVEAAARQHYLRETTPATMYAVMGQPDKAIRWLERGFDSHAGGIILIGRMSEFLPLHSDPRFQALVKRAGLPPVT